MSVLSSRLPGITFRTQPPQRTAALPPMDIAAFVGLAASGPLHVPVAVEDPVRFRDLFGPDLPLAWDSEEGQLQHSLLGPAVEAFFHNGGRRCWVVRVADEVEATTTLFPLPGLVRADSWRPATARARCPGSWADNLCAGSALVAEAVTLVDFTPSDPMTGAPYTLEVAMLPDDLVAGDLLRLRFFDADLLLFLPLSRVAQRGRSLLAEAPVGYWFRTVAERSPPPLPVEVVRLETTGPLSPLPLGAEQPLDARSVDLALSLASAPEPGDLLQLRYDAPDGPLQLLPVYAREAVTGSASPPEDGVRVSALEGYWPLTEVEGRAAWEALSAGSREPVVERVTFELWVWQGQEVVARSGRLAFCSSHPRFWGSLPTDEAYFRSEVDRPRSEPAAIAAEALEPPRFPLAGSAEPATVYLPLGMFTRAERASCQGPSNEVASETRLQRDGLATFDATLFLDARLQALRSRNLMVEATHRYYVLKEALRGIHSLVPIEEVSLVTVPDAVHRAWQTMMAVGTPLLEAPELHPAMPGRGAPDGPFYTLRWDGVTCVDLSGGEVETCHLIYQLQEALEPTFPDATTLYRGPEQHFEVFNGATCPQPRYYRVRAIQEGLVGPWSITRGALLPPGQFEPCGEEILPAPRLLSVTVVSGESSFLLEWSAVPEATGYEVQEDVAPALPSPTARETTGTQLYVPRRGARTVYFRVRALRGAIRGPWSNTRCVPGAPESQMQLVAPESYEDDELLDVQLALMRLCAARGDLFALLSLPRHYRVEEAVAHQKALTWMPGEQDPPLRSAAHVPSLNPDERGAFSYAALYHPWIYTQQAVTPEAAPAAVAVTAGMGRAVTTAAARLQPPEGAVCGTYAARALSRGAWIAPANVPLRRVVALAPSLDGARWGTGAAALFASQINGLQRDPRGFMVLSAETLSPESAWQPVNVRRLIILLRRFALREGERYVFQNNDRAFRRLIRRHFSRLLGELFKRGAFAGSSPEQSYQVRVDGGLNDRHHRERGRLVVELRVAPSRPAAFITVRLIQHGLEGLTVEET